MNEFTQEIVERVARNHPKLARADYHFEFDSEVIAEHWRVMMDTFGYDLQVRVSRLALVFFPHLFDEDGDWAYMSPYFRVCQEQLLHKVKRVLESKIRRHPEQWMLYKWDGILPEILDKIDREKKPQMNLF